MSLCMTLSAVLLVMAQPASVADLDHGTIAALQPGDRVELGVLQDVSISGAVQRRRSYAPGRVVVSGRLEPGTRGHFAIAVNGTALAGYIVDGSGTTYRIGTAPDGRALVEQVDVAALQSCASAAPVAPVAHDGIAAGTCDDGSVIDVLVVYTQAARNAAGGVAAIEAEIDVMVEFNNVAFVSSLVDTTWNLVYVWGLGPGVNPSLAELTSPNDGVADGVHALRDAYGADQVALIIAGQGGVANGLFNLDPASEATAFTLSGRESAPVVLSHEIGHNLGCCHPVGAGGGCPLEGGLLFPYSNGHTFTGDSGMFWGTVMAGGNDLQHFSNPDVVFDGQSTGIEPGLKHPGADNALTINLSKLTVSNWRCNNGICEALGLPSTAPDSDGNGIPDACDLALSCIWDCATNDGVVGIDEFLAVLAQWGKTGTACDLGAGAPGVGIDEFLQILANWGICP